MIKKLLALFLLIVFCVPAFATVKGLEVNKEEQLLKIKDNLFVPEGVEVKSAMAIGGNVNVNGTVKEDVTAVGGDVTLSKTAIVNGNVVSVGGKVIRENGSQIIGKASEVPIPAGYIINGFTVLVAIIGIVSFLAFLVLAIVLSAFCFKQIGRISFSIEKQVWWALLTGILALFIIPLSFVILIFSIIGILLIPLYIILLVIAGIFGYISIAQLVGKKVLKAFKILRQPMAIEVVFGLVLLTLLSLVPFVGMLIKCLVMLIGFGAVVITRFGTAE